MQRKTIGIVIALVIVAGLGIGLAATHKTAKKQTPVSSTSSNISTTSNAVVQTKTSSNFGQYLADTNGNALYTYIKDTRGVSNCYGSCVASWPIYAATSVSANLPTNITVVTRTDGSKQYAYKGLPLYTFVSDSNGQVTGDGVGGFSVAKP